MAYTGDGVPTMRERLPSLIVSVVIIILGVLAIHIGLTRRIAPNGTISEARAFAGSMRSNKMIYQAIAQIATGASLVFFTWLAVAVSKQAEDE
jgi:hypothetical protein